MSRLFHSHDVAYEELKNYPIFTSLEVHVHINYALENTTGIRYDSKSGHGSLPN